MKEQRRSTRTLPPHIKIIAQRLKQTRMDAGMNQKQLAITSRVLPSCICNLERGRSGTSVYLLIRLADALCVSLDYLVGRSDFREIRK